MPKVAKRKKTAKKSRRKRIPAGSKKVMLTNENRIFLGETLTGRDSVAARRIMRQLKERISLSEAEMKAMGYQASKDGRLQAWAKPGRAKGFTFSAFELDAIVGGLKKMDQEKNIDDGHLVLWDKFIGKKGDTPE